MRIIGDISGIRGRRKGFVFLGICIAVGIIAGSVMAAENSIHVDSAWFHQFFSPLNGGGTFSETVGRSALSSVIFLAAVFFSGFFVFGQPIGVALLVWRGVGIGISVAEMYKIHGAGAIPEVIMLILPKAFVSAIVAVLAVRELIRSSNMLMNHVINAEKADNEKYEIRLYIIKFLVLFIISLISVTITAAAEVLIT